MTPIPLLPAPLAQGVRFLPRAPLSFALTRLARRLAARHPGMVVRLGSHADARFALDPTDLPVVLHLSLCAGEPRLDVRADAAGADCRIAGPLAALLGLVHGAYDGDALFFSRDLVVEGDTAAALALRNAVDDAELDLLDEASALVPPLARALPPLAALAQRWTGVALRRAAPPHGSTGMEPTP